MSVILVLLRWESAREFQKSMGQVSWHREQESTTNIQTYVLGKVEGTLHYPVTSVHVPHPPPPGDSFS